VDQLLNRVPRRAFHEIVDEWEDITDQVDQDDHDKHSSQGQLVGLVFGQLLPGFVGSPNLWGEKTRN
jgi:hypothetical protein